MLPVLEGIHPAENFAQLPRGPRGRSTALACVLTHSSSGLGAQTSTAHSGNRIVVADLEDEPFLQNCLEHGAALLRRSLICPGSFQSKFNWEGSCTGIS